MFVKCGKQKQRQIFKLLTDTDLQDWTQYAAASTDNVSKNSVWEQTGSVLLCEFRFRGFGHGFHKKFRLGILCLGLDAKSQVKYFWVLLAYADGSVEQFA